MQSDEKELKTIQLTKITKSRSCYDCELCGFEPKSTNEKFGQPLERHDHLVGKDHFKEKIANISNSICPPFNCPIEKCTFKVILGPDYLKLN